MSVCVTSLLIVMRYIPVLSWTNRSTVHFFLLSCRLHVLINWLVCTVLLISCLKFRVFKMPHICTCTCIPHNTLIFWQKKCLHVLLLEWMQLTVSC